MPWTFIASTFTNSQRSSQPNSQLHFSSWCTYLDWQLRNEIAKFVVNFWNFNKHTCQTFGVMHCNPSSFNIKIQIPFLSSIHLIVKTISYISERFAFYHLFTSQPSVMSTEIKKGILLDDNFISKHSGLNTWLNYVNSWRENHGIDWSPLNTRRLVVKDFSFRRLTADEVCLKPEVLIYSQNFMGCCQPIYWWTFPLNQEYSLTHQI